MGKGMHTCMVLIDFQKTFDAIDHKILFEKRTCICFKTETLNDLSFMYQVENSSSLRMVFSPNVQL